ncbi:MAG: FHA domain-containing protein [Tyzzerella sp.]|nr:FHA domain-containing protein [Tyzzerella sp.]
MKFIFENQGTNTYLVYTVVTDDVVDSMSLGMLTNNKIDGLATTLFMQVDMTKYIKYNVSAKVSVKQFFTGSVNKKRLLGVFNGIVDAMMAAEEYMIDTNTILLDLDYIFADVSTCETVLICLPVINKNVNNMGLGTFFKNIVFSTQFDQTENCDYVAKIINHLNSAPVFSLADFSKLLKEIQETEAPVQVGAVQEKKPQPTVSKQIQEQPQKQIVEQQPISAQIVPQQIGTQPLKEPLKQVENPQQVPPKQGYPVPEQKPMQQNTVQQPSQPVAKNEQKISMFYLLQHYNKENAALYKAQKEAEKAAKKGRNSAKMSVLGTPTQKTLIQATQPNKGFAIPGQAPQTPHGFAIPGQAPQTPQGFAIPGQPAQPLSGMVKPNQSVASQSVNNMQPQKVAPAEVTSLQPIPTPIQAAPQARPMNFGETTVLNGATFGETTVLNAGMVQQEIKLQPYLIRTKNNERIELNKPVFRIGKEKSYVDYFISDNTAISRSHANIITRDGEYFVVDTNSTNHTYINGMMIQSNVETKIEDGAKIRLANEDFDFKLL